MKMGEVYKVRFRPYASDIGSLEILVFAHDKAEVENKLLEAGLIHPEGKTGFQDCIDGIYHTEIQDVL